ncbi:alpha-amylase A-like [Culicoides brevitarsis]|uniref:alpha-amylase A-like n=1 Tax=Culicoides brevitarsis TaxID=469753 RepID=UPI00307BCA8E
MNVRIFIIFLQISLISCYGNHDPQFVAGRSGIVHLFEWKWLDIAHECESFLGPNGFAGVQVSPVQENVIIPNRPWYERYQPQSYKIITRSGNEAEFAEMTKRCNAAGVRIYVDIIFNHMAAHQGDGTGGSSTNVSELEFPEVPYSAQHFNENCEIQDYTDAVQVRDCRLVGLPDLDQSREGVRSKIVDLMNKLINLGVAGFRVDAAKHMWPSDLEIIYGRLLNLNTEFGFPMNAKPFIVQEVIDLGGEGINKYEYDFMAAVTEFKFSAEIGKCFRGKTPLAKMSNWGEEWGFLPSNHALVFVDNHDNQRGHGAGGEDILTYKQGKIYKMAVAFTLAHPYGIPRIMSSFAFDNSDQGPPMDADENLISPTFDAETGQCNDEKWICEHRWQEIRNMVQFRNKMGDSAVQNWWDNGDKQIAFARGNKGFVAFNLQEDADLEEELSTGLKAGKYCDVVSKSWEKCFVVDENGKVTIKIAKDDPIGFVALMNDVSRVVSYAVLVCFCVFLTILTA